MEKKYNQDEIDLYVNSQLEGQDLIDFEQDLVNNEQLSRKVNITRDLDKAIDDYVFEQDLANKLKIISANYPNEKTNSTQKSSSKTINKWWILIMIGVLTGTVFVYFWQSTKQVIPTTNEEIFALYYEPYSSLQSDRSSATEKDYKAIVEQYDNQQYNEVVSLLETFLTKNLNQPNAQLMLGNALLNIGEFEKAIDQFQAIVRSDNPLFMEVGQWYLALTYLKNNDKNNARPILEQIAQKTNGKYPKLAKELLTNF